MAKCLLCTLGLAAILNSGCSGPRSGAPKEAARTLDRSVEQLNLLTMPLALNLDSKPGADGFALKVFAGNRTQPKPIPIEEGTLEVLMFDGGLSKPATETTPILTWRFTIADLEPFQFRTSIGVGYNLTLRWGEARPKENRITVVARLTLPAGPPIYSAASSISVVSN